MNMNMNAKFRRSAIALAVCSMSIVAGPLFAQETVDELLTAEQLEEKRADIEAKRKEVQAKEQLVREEALEVGASLEDSSEINLEEIVVSGSRIQRAEFSQPTPIISLGAEEIRRFGTPDLGSILAELPAVGASGTLAGNTSGSGEAQGGNERAGISSPDLRRLGLNRTLTLIDGKRHVGAVAGSAQVDLSTVPTALIERVDILTGGASAIYGSDAVSGVVNVVLKDNFEGFSVDVRGNDSLEGVGDESYSASIAAGFNFAEDKGNIAFFANYDQVGRIFANDVRQFSNFGTIVNPDDTGEEDGIPDRLTVANVNQQFCIWQLP